MLARSPSPVRRSLTLALICLCVGSTAWAQRVGAVLMVEDTPVTEPIGVAAYRPFLEQAGVYERLVVLQGGWPANTRLAAAIRQVAADCDLVDVFISVHSTKRSAEEMQKLVPPEARKLRLVYSSACGGALLERQAWEQLGARSVVTFRGINNPLIAMPYFLSGWIRGEALEDVVEAGYGEEVLTTRMALSLPGGRAALTSFLDSSGTPDFYRGSQPVLTGEPRLTIRSGLGKVRLLRPERLRYSRRSGGSPGLALRAMIGQIELSGAELREAVGVFGGVSELPISLEQLERIRVVPIYRRERPKASGSVAYRRVFAGAALELKQRKPQRIPLEQMKGVELVLRRTVRIRPGRLDPERRTLRLHVDGVWVSRGALKFRVAQIDIKPAATGYRATIAGGAYGVVPLWGSLAIGGEPPLPLPDDMSVLQFAPNQPGIEDEISTVAAH